MGAARSPEEIRRSIEQNRADLGVALEKLKGEVAQLADWRTKLQEHQPQALAGAAVAGFVLGGGIAALGALVTLPRRRKRRKQSLLASLTGS